MNYFSEKYIRALCGAINDRLKATDDRPLLSEADLDAIQAQIANEPHGDVDFKIIFAFFVHKRFLQPAGQDGWLVNSRLDEEWAINIFSEHIDLLATGVYKLDDILKGGFRAYKKYVGAPQIMQPISVVLQGRPGTGKTTTALLMLCNFASQGYSSLYLSAEQNLPSLVRTVERFCTNIQRQSFEGDYAVYDCTLRKAQGSDAKKELERQIKRARQPKTKEHIDDSVRAFLLEKESDTQKRPSNGTFFVALLGNDDIANQSAFRKAIESRKERGIHGIILTRVALSYDPKASYPVGPVFGPSSEAFIGYLQDLRTMWTDRISWLVIDSVTAFASVGSRFMSLVLQAEEPELSRFMLTEDVSMRADTPTDLETSCDMLIELGERNLQIAAVKDSPSNYMQRYLEIKKFRSSPFYRGKHPMAIKSNGVKVFRSTAILLKVTGNNRREPVMASDNKLHFGIDGLDGTHGLNGSISKGSFTVIQGPPGSFKTAICSYFLTADILAAQRQALARKSGKLKHEGVGRSLLYSFGADRRSIISGMRSFVADDLAIFEDQFLKETKESPALVEIHDIKSGYMFPEAFVEDLMDTLSKANGPDAQPRQKITRIVFDSFDAIQAAYPIMRMDNFFWKVIGQICWDYGVSVLLKASSALNTGDGEIGRILSGIGDNVIQVDETGALKIVNTEHRVHNTGQLHLERTFIRQSPSSPSKVWLRVRA